MGIAIFSDVHADAGAFSAFRAFIADPLFAERFGTVDLVVNLGDLLHRGDHPREVLEAVHTLSRDYRLVSVMGNHDHAFLNDIAVSGSDAASLYRHDQLRGSPLLSIYESMPVEWIENGMLFVHGGPMDLGPSLLRQKFWQRLSPEPGDTFAGYHYTPAMAFAVLRERGLRFLCCGHQHTTACFKDHEKGIQDCWLDYVQAETGMASGSLRYETAKITLDWPAVMRIGACFGPDAEFAYTDFQDFHFIRLL
jgi:predicted phosphodiesterase